MSKSFKIFLSLAVFLAVAVSLNAGIPPSPPTTGAGPPCWPPPCVPIDGGITFLAVAGIAYAGKKLHEKRKKDASPSITE